MKTNKLPKALWVAFNGLMKPCDVGKVMCKGWYFKRKRYHLHQSGEAAKVMNWLHKYDADWLDPNSVAVRLRKAGFRVRWDAKAGRFV